MAKKNLYNPKDKVRLKESEPFESGLTKEVYRDDWRRDYARLVHSPGFRRLQGKTQLFPGVESDFFRNRLTHSLEVAQIAKSIAIKINHEYMTDGSLRQNKKGKGLEISTDLIEFAGLAHDLGHPPFGHQGEEALDKCMITEGGFEGNAQTIRLLSKIEKKFKVDDNVVDGKTDKRVGLNLCMRTLGSVLKYDRKIPISKTDRLSLSVDLGGTTDDINPVKGYYECDNELVEKIKSSVLNGFDLKGEDFKTLECGIMDIADDIAYSTYDLEDGFKAGFISPLDLLYPNPELLEKVTLKVNKNLVKENVDVVLTKHDIIDKIRQEFLSFDEDVINVENSITPQIVGENFHEFATTFAHTQYKVSKLIAKDGSWRTGFTSSIVGKFIRGVKLKYNKDCPAISKAILDDKTRILVEILKTFTFLSQIASPRLKIAEVRGKEIVTKIFNSLNEDKGYHLLPDDFRIIYEQASGSYRKRIICDYIACMTDRYAIEFYGRLTSENPKTIFKPF